MAPKKVTLSDVARLAKVSTTTASYIINGRGSEMRISPDTTERVLATASALGYRPNMSARSLRTARTATIGLVSDYLATGHYASHMLLGAATAARTSNHVLLIGETAGDPEVEALLIADMLSRQVDGIIYATLTNSQVTVPETLLNGRTVLLNCHDPLAGLPSVTPDEVAGGRAAVAALCKGRPPGRIVVVGEDPNSAGVAGPKRLRGIFAECADRKLVIETVLACDWAVPAARETIRAWLQAGERADSLICMNDRIAFGAYQALDAAGLRIPEDVSLVSFDGTELATWLQPSLTSVSLPLAEIGELAVQVLRGDQDCVGQLLVPMPVLDGESIASS